MLFVEKILNATAKGTHHHVLLNKTICNRFAAKACDGPGARPASPAADHEAAESADADVFRGRVHRRSRY